MNKRANAYRGAFFPRKNVLEKHFDSSYDHCTYISIQFVSQNEIYLRGKVNWL